MSGTCRAAADRSHVYFEDLPVGTVLEHPGRALSGEEIIAFAREFDPEPFHVDREAAEASHFGGLVASGAHTFALWRRLNWETQVRHGWVTLAGAGFDRMRLARPLRPGERVRLRTEVVDKRPSRTRPDRGVIKTRETLFVGSDDAVMTLLCTAIMARRPQSENPGPDPEPGPI